LSLLLNLLLFVIANGFLGDLVEKTEDNGGEDEPERDEGILGVAELDILCKLGKVLETEWARCSKKCFLFGMVNFTILTEPGKVLEILLIVNTVNFTVISEPGKILKVFTQSTGICSCTHTHTHTCTESTSCVSLFDNCRS
jgi:hypothetical protein